MAPGLSRLHPLILLCLVPLLVGAAAGADLRSLTGRQPLPPPVPPLLEKLLELRRSLAEGPEPLFPAPPGYRLPWAAARSHAVVQAPGEGPTHQSLHAWDFDLKYELVLAARGGRVSMVRATQRQGGCDSSFIGRANYILIDHGDGTSALYLHIDYDGALVKEGALVAQGDVIAYSGSSGLSCGGGGWSGPHLHFQVQRTEPGEWWTTTIPVSFDELDGGTLATGRRYVSRNLPSSLVSRVVMSRFPWRAARGAEIYVPPSRSFLSQLSLRPAATPVVIVITPPTPVPTPTATPTPMPDWWMGPAATPTIPVPNGPRAPAPSEVPVPRRTPTAQATPVG